jgi:hypothetical protein
MGGSEWLGGSERMGASERPLGGSSQLVFSAPEKWGGRLEEV